VLARHGSALDPFVLLDSYSAEAKPLQNGTHQNGQHLGYKVILRRGYAAAFAKHGIPATAEEIESIVESIRTMGPHPETVDVLRRLKTRYRLAIFTNSDDDLIVHNVRLLQVPIDHVITAEQAQAYKPSRRIFEHAHRAMGVTKDETDARRDVAGAGHAGLPAARHPRRVDQPAGHSRPIRTGIPMWSCRTCGTLPALLGVA
jgi:2-haloacid dehalogenase